MQNCSGHTALYLAAINFGNEELVRLLLEHGAYPNIQDSYGDTPLHRAAYSGYKEVVELLIAHGADTQIKDSDGKTARCIALDRGHTEIATTA